jgi:hypothetical protein
VFLAPPAGVPSGAQPGWRDALDALGAQLAAAAPRLRALRVVLSDQFVRYLVVPWDDALRTTEERLAYLSHHYRSVYGERVGSWCMAAGDVGSDSALCLAAAVDEALVDALHALAGQHGATLRSVVPHAVAALNTSRRAIDARSCFVAVREPGALCLLRIGDGEVRAVAARRHGADAARALRSMLALEAAGDDNAGRAELPVYLIEWGEECPELAPPFKPQPLAGETSAVAAFA